MGVAKYFVWGEGVWREVDVSSGRVTGWRRRARFVFVRRGRLLVARSRAVLRALAALAAGQPSAAADGPRLSHRSKSASHINNRHKQPAAPAVPARVPAACEHHHCCAHFNGYNSIDKVVDRAVAPPGPPILPPQRREAGIQCGSRDASTSTERAHAFTINVKHRPTATAAPDSSSADELVSTYVQRRPTPPVRCGTNEVSALLGKPTPAAASEPPAATFDKKRTPLTSNRADKSSDERRDRATTGKRPRAIISDKTDSTSADERRAVCKELIISEDDVAALRGFVARTRASALARFDADDAYKRALFYAINPLVELERCARLELLLSSRHEAAQTHFAARLGLTPLSSAPSTPSIPPRSLRRLPAARYRDASADADKENMNKHTSPNKVGSDRNIRKQRAEVRPAASEPALRHTRASGARLRVSERSNREVEVVGIKAPEVNGGADSDSEPPPAKRAAAPERNNYKAESVSDAEPTASSSVHQPLAAARTHVISKRALASNAKEYSNLEDHAIVAWVSGGSRASLVNGNRMWREMQEQYSRLTGITRSWHSLRNRYLRYILPSLGALGLPPADVSRLRAAAATGAIKTKQRVAAGLTASDVRVRRNSLFKESVRGASSRGRSAHARAEDAPAAATANDDARGLPARRSLRARGAEAVRSPRYSEVTRRFASPAPRPPSPLLQAAPARSRRLFNHNSYV